jgi:hypothetical protein
MSLLAGYRNQVIYKPLEPGQHEVVLLSYEEKEDKAKVPYLSVTFAPTSNTAHLHHIALYQRENFDGVKALAITIAKAKSLDGVSTPDIYMHHLKDTVTTFTLEPYTIATPTGQRTGFNWLVYAKDIDTTPPPALRA